MFVVLLAVDLVMKRKNVAKIFTVITGKNIMYNYELARSVSDYLLT